MFQRILENISVAFSAIRMNRLRATLTVFIIAFGIMSLISMLTAVRGMEEALTSSFAQVGSNTFTIKSAQKKTKFRRRGFRHAPEKPITYKEARAFQQRFEFPANVALSFNASWGTTVQYGKVKTPPKINVTGADHNHLSVSGFQLEEGRNFTEGEVNSGASVILIGSKLKTDLFREADPIGKRIAVAGRKFTVIGSLAEKGSSFGGSQDNVVIMPLQAAQSTFSSQEDIYDLSVQTFRIEDMEGAIQEATGLFRSIRKLSLGEEDDFEIVTNDALVGALKDNVSQIATFALVIGFITLLGAAVALTNIMLVSVTERTREIGVRKAMGATTIKIRNQFLLEAVVICQMGGLLGILLGILLGNVVSSFMGSGFVVPWGWVIFGVLLCFGVGVLAGLYPALKAAKQDPIDALRYE